MRSVLSIVLLCTAVLGAAAKESDVKTLTYSTIPTVYTGDWLLVLYAPWCGHCQNLLPILPQVAAMMKSGTRVAKADADAAPALQAQFGLAGFPMIYHIHDGEVREYTGNHEFKSIVAFADGGWRSQEPLSKWFGPTSVLKRAFGAYAWGVMALYSKLGVVAEKIGVRTEMLAIGVGVVIVLACIAMTIVALMTQPEPAPQQQPRQRNKATAKKEEEEKEKKKEGDSAKEQKKEDKTKAKDATKDVRQRKTAAKKSK